MNQESYQQLVKNAEIALEIKDFKNARKLYEELKEIDPNRVDTLLIHAQLLIYETKKYDEALKLLQIIIEKNPNQALAYCKEALCLMLINKYEEGILKCNQSIKLDSMNYDNYFHKGIMLSNLKREEEAKEVFKILEELKPKSDKEFLIQGLYRIYQKQDEEALKIFLESLQVFPTSVKLNYYCSKQCLKLKKYQEAIKYLDIILELNEDWSGGWMEKAKINKELKQYNKALCDLNLALELDSSNNTLFTLKAQIFKEQNKYEEAIDLLNSRLNMEDQNQDEQILYELAESNYSLDRVDEAIQALKKLLDQSPNLHEIWNKLGNYQMSQKFWQEAFQSFIKSSEIDPTYKIAFYNQGLTLNNLNKQNEALKTLDKCLELDPKYLNALKLKAEIFEKQQKHKSALEYFEKYLEIDPKDTDILNLKGLVLIKLEKYSESLACFGQIIQIKPLQSAYFNKGLCYRMLQKYNESLKAFDQSLEIDPKYINSYIQKAKIFKSLQKYRQAFECLEQCYKIDDQNIEALYDKALLHGIMKEEEKAIQIYDLILKIDSNQYIALYNKGCSYQALVKYDQAIECFDKSLVIKPNYSPSMYAKGRTLKFLNYFDEAEKIFHSLFILEPTNEDCLYELAMILKEQTQKQSQAIEIFKKLLEINPKHQLALQDYGLLLYHQNQWKKSIPILLRSIELNPCYITILLTLSYAYFNLQLYDDSLVWSKKIIAIDPNHLLGHFQTGKALKELGQYTQALESFDLALKINPKYANCFEQKFRVLSLMKLESQALEELEKAIQLEPNNYEFQQLKGTTYFIQNEPGKALNIYLKTDTIKLTATRCYNIALCYQRMKNLQLAIEYHSKALKADPQYIPSYCQRARINIQTQKKEALEDLRIAKDLLQNPPSYITAEQLKFCQNTINLLLNIDSDMIILQMNLTNKNQEEKQQIQVQLNDITQKKSKIIESLDNQHNSNTLEIQILIDEINQLKNLVMFQQKSIENHNSQIQSLNQENAQIYKILDQSGIRDLAIVKGELENLYKTDLRAYEYFKVFYWTLLNYFNAYRTLSTGLVQANYNHDTEEMIMEKMTIVGAKKTLEISKELLKSIPFIGAGVTLVDQLLERFFELKKKIEFKKRVMIITSIIQKDNGKDILFDDINIIVAKGVLAICQQKQKYIQKVNLKKIRIDKKIIENTIQTIDKVRGNLGSAQTDLYNGEIAMYALEDIMFLLNTFYENGDVIAKSNKSLDQIIVDVVVFEQKKEKNKECILF